MFSSKLNRDILGSICIHVSAGALVLILQWFLARIMITSQYGTYAYAMSWLTLFVLISNRGFDVAILRYIPEYLSQKKGGLTGGIIRYASNTTLAFGGLIAFGTIVWAITTVAYFTDDPGTAKTMAAGCLLVPLLGLAKVRLAALKGTGHVIKALLPEMIFAPVLIIVGAGLFAAIGHHVNAPLVMFISVVAFLISYCIGNRWLKSTLIKLGLNSKKLRQNRIKWRRTSYSLFVLTGMHVVINNTDIIMLGLLKDHRAAGIYAVCSKSANIIAFTLTMVNAIVIPQISNLYFSGQYEMLKQIIGRGIRFVSAMALPICIFFMAGGFFYLDLYGKDFREGVNALRILSIGQTLNALSGPVAYLAALTGHERVTAYIISSCALLNVFLNIVLIPIWGINGAALSTSLTIGLWNISLVYYICNKLKMNFYGYIFRKV